MPLAADRDLELWRQWRRTRAMPDLEALMRQMQPVLAREVNRWVATTPRFLLENEAKALALKAFETYDEHRQPPVKLSTHVTTWLAKLSRLAYERQNTLAVPEQKRLLFNHYDRVRKEYEDEHGRAPTLHEAADKLHVTPAHLTETLRVVGTREYLSSSDEEGPMFVSGEDPETLHLAYHDMTPLQKEIFARRTGYGGRIVQANPVICRELKITQGQLSHQLTAIKKLLARARDLRR